MWCWFLGICLTPYADHEEILYLCRHIFCKDIGRDSRSWWAVDPTLIFGSVFQLSFCGICVFQGFGTSPLPTFNRCSRVSQCQSKACPMLSWETVDSPKYLRRSPRKKMIFARWLRMKVKGIGPKRHSIERKVVSWRN